MGNYVRLIRPAEWVKNVFVLAGLVFSAKATDPHAIGLSLIAFAAFCLAASATYIINDIRDREQDRLHPVKKRLFPESAGKIPAIMNPNLPKEEGPRQ